MKSADYVRVRSPDDIGIVINSTDIEALVFHVGKRGPTIDLIRKRSLQKIPELSKEVMEANGELDDLHEIFTHFVLETVIKEDLKEVLDDNG